MIGPSSRATAWASTGSFPTSWARATGSPRTPPGQPAICGMPAEMVRDLARRMASDAHDAQCRLVFATRGPWRAALLDGGRARSHARPDRPAWRQASASAMAASQRHGCAAPPHPGADPASQGKTLWARLIPVARIADMLLHPGEPYDFNGADGPIPTSGSSTGAAATRSTTIRTSTAWSTHSARPDTVIVHEPWWTATVRYADIVLPATTTLERNDIGVEPAAIASLCDVQGGRAGGTGTQRLRHLRRHRRTAGLRGTALPRAGTRWTGFATSTTSGAAACSGASGRGCQPSRSSGRRAMSRCRRRDKPFVMLADFRADPRGAPSRHAVRQDRDLLRADRELRVRRLPGSPGMARAGGMAGRAEVDATTRCISCRTSRARGFTASSTTARVSQASKVRGREPLRIHSDDAAARGIAEGDVVRVFNERGQCLAGAVVTKLLRAARGAACHRRVVRPARPGQAPEPRQARQPNCLTIDKGTSRLAQGPIAHSCLVEVERWRGPLPPITAFDPPASM